MKIKEWLQDVRGKGPAKESYVDSAELPPEPEGPYRARMAVAQHTAAPEGIDVTEREVVAGALQLLFRIRCPCGQHWESTDFHRMSICPKCGRAVLVDVPTLPTE